MPEQQNGGNPEAGLPAPLPQPRAEIAVAPEYTLEERIQQIIDGAPEDEALNHDEVLFQERRQMQAELEAAAPEQVAEEEVVYRPVLEDMLRQANQGNQRQARLGGPLGGAGGLVEQGAEAELAAMFRPLKHYPGYAMQGPETQAFREMGRSIFEQLPCYTEMMQACRARGYDPLGEVNVLFLNGAQMEASRAGEVIRGLMARGLPLQAQAFEALRRMHRYSPEMSFCFGDEDSYLVMRESQANGGPRQRGAPPQDFFYIYAWKGGRRFYANNPGREQALRALAQLPGQVAAQPPEHRQAQLPGRADVPPQRALPGAEQRPEAQAPVVPAAPPPGAPAQQLAARRPAPAVAPAAPANRLALPAPQAAKPANPMQEFRQAGFTAVSSAAGPVLKRVRDDGMAVVVRGTAGKSIVLARSFIATLHADGDIEQHPVAEEQFDSASAVVAWGEEFTPGGFRP